MKTVLVVFTGTGNTLKVARDLAAALPEETEIIRLSHRSFPEEIRADKVIILYPVYCFGLPAMVHGWLGLVRFPDNPLVYGVATYGGLLCAAGRMLKTDTDAGLPVQRAFRRTHAGELRERV